MNERNREKSSAVSSAAVFKHYDVSLYAALPCCMLTADCH